MESWACFLFFHCVYTYIEMFSSSLEELVINHIIYICKTIFSKINYSLFSFSTGFIFDRKCTPPYLQAGNWFSTKTNKYKENLNRSLSCLSPPQNTQVSSAIYCINHIILFVKQINHANSKLFITNCQN